MFRLRNEQLAAFEADARRRDLARMRDHAREHFPEQVEGLSLDEFDACLWRLAGEAGAFGLSGMDEVLLFVNLSLHFGEGFLEMPRHFWMRQIMTDPSIPSAGERIRTIHEEAVLRGVEP